MEMKDGRGGKWKKCSISKMAILTIMIICHTGKYVEWQRNRITPGNAFPEFIKELTGAKFFKKSNQKLEGSFHKAGNLN